jgi:hypothetical protein
LAAAEEVHFLGSEACSREGLGSDDEGAGHFGAAVFRGHPCYSGVLDARMLEED